MEPEWNISACGLNCAACDFYKAGKGDTAKQQEIIDWFKRDHDKDIKPEQTMCNGCHGTKNIHWSPDCPMMNCAEQKTVNICYECPEFICAKLEAFAKDGSSTHHRTVENLKEMKKKGLEAWIRDQKTLELCP